MTSCARRFASAALLACLAAAIPARAQSASTAALRFFGTGAQVPDATVAEWILAFLVRGFEPAATSPPPPAVTRRAAPRSRPRRA